MWMMLVLPPPASAGDVVVRGPAATWTEQGDERLVRITDADPSLAWSLEAEASLGGLSTRWYTLLPAPEPDGSLSARVDVPDSAFLHDVALDFLTVLRVYLVGTDDAGRPMVRTRLPPAFLAWPDGRAAGSVVWDLPTARALAPNGIVNAELRRSLGDRGDAWVVPPTLTDLAERRAE